MNEPAIKKSEDWNEGYSKGYEDGKRTGYDVGYEDGAQSVEEEQRFDLEDKG